MPPFYNKEGSQRVSSTTKKGEFNKRFESMKVEAAHYISSWRSLREYLNPTKGVFSETTPMRGKMIDHKKVLDAYATNSIKKTASGLNSGVTSKARAWFRLVLADSNLMEFPAARLWLDEVQKRMYVILEGSNIYGTFQNVYEEILTFGTACFILLEDSETVIRTRNFTIGEYYLAVDKKGKVNSFARSFDMTVEQLISEFGYEKCTPAIQAQWDSNQLDVKFRVRHLIEPNVNRNAMMDDFENMPFRSAYWVKGDQVADDFLAVRGFKRFVVVAPRWSVPTTDIVYGYGPGWDMLGDVKELQKTKYDKLLLQEKLHNPPIQSDASVEGHVNTLPGGVTKTSGTVPNAGVRAAYQVDARLDSFIESINECKKSINRHCFTDLFTMLAVLDRGEMTAREVAAREQERIMLMGPILNQLDEEMLSVVIELLFGIMSDNGLLPLPPKEIQEQPIKVQYISVLAQLQRSVGSAAVEKLVGYVASVAEVAPEARDVINWDETVREIGEMEGVPSKIINDELVVEEIREQRAMQQNMAATAEMAKSAADTSKTLSETEMGKGSALDKLMPAMPKAE